MGQTLPTPEELGEKIERGEMSESEAVEIMAERIRREALPFLYPPSPEPAPGSSYGGLSRLAYALVLAVCAVGLCVLLWFM